MPLKKLNYQTFCRSHNKKLHIQPVDTMSTDPIRFISQDTQSTPSTPSIKSKSRRPILLPRLYKRVGTQDRVWMLPHKTQKDCVNVCDQWCDPTRTLFDVVTIKEFEVSYEPVLEIYKGESLVVTKEIIERIIFVKYLAENRSLVNIICIVPVDMMSCICCYLTVKDTMRLSKCSKQLRLMITDMTGIGEEFICSDSNKLIPSVDRFKICIWGSLDHLVKTNLADLIFRYLDMSDVMNLFSVNKFSNLRLTLMMASPNIEIKLSMNSWNNSVTIPKQMSEFYPTVMFVPAPEPIKIINIWSGETNIQQLGESLIYNGKPFYKKTIVLSKPDSNKRYYQASHKSKSIKRRNDDQDVMYDRISGWTDDRY